ncbi:MFS transporter [soil metagenome]
MTSTTPELRLLAPRYLWTTIGSNALIFLAAFEALAVTTVMPVISRELHGQALYSLGFSGNLAASIIGMVVAGGWSDRRGPAGSLVTATVTFLAGLLVAGLAPDMTVFIVGRFLQGLGSGAIIVALYVVIARVYPAALHPRIFGVFAAMWVVPSLVGPPVAGFIADTVSWHWVFLGVAGLVVLASALMVPVFRDLEPSAAPGNRGDGWRVVWAVVAAAGVLAVSLGGSLWLPIVGFVVVVIAIRPLLPSGTLIVRRGLPSTILLRGAVAATFFATEIYLPYLLTSRYGLPSWAAGLILTVGAVSWALGSWIQGRLERMSHHTALRIGAVLLVLGVTVEFVTAFWLLSPVIAGVGWFLAGGGMGIIFPRLNTLVLASSGDGEQGANTAAMSIADAAGGAVSIAVAGLLFTATSGSFAVALGYTAVVGVASVVVAVRARA